MVERSAQTRVMERAVPIHGTRMAFIDNLRVALTALVVFHHAAITYGASGSWYLREAPEGSSPLLGLFWMVNQAFFMGFFFLIAGYFTPASYDRKGLWQFAADRLIRLGIPLLVFGFVLDPFTVALAYGHGASGVLALCGRLMGRGWFSSGPLWFAQALLNFAAAYLLWRAFVPGSSAIERPLPNHRTLLAAALVTGVIAFTLRLEFPVGWTMSNLQLGYFASYGVLFIAGIAGARGRWLERVPLTLARPWLIVSVLALVGMIATFRMFGPRGYAGGWTIEAVIYAFFEPFFAWGVILGLLRLFRVRFNGGGKAMRFLSARAFTVYIVHPPVLVGAALVLHDWNASALTKFAAAGTLACIGCVAVGSMILAVPGARRVL